MEDGAHGRVWCRARTDENREQVKGQLLGSIVTMGSANESLLFLQSP